MRRNILFLLAVLTSLATLHAQKIEYAPTFQEAKKLAAEKQKPLAVLITIEQPRASPDRLKGLDDRAVIEKFNTSFINYRVAREDTAASRQIIRDYKVYRFPGFLFIDPKGGVMFSDVAILSRAELLLQLADRAVLASREKSLLDYDNEYRSGINNRDFLKAYISKRQKAGIADNSELIEKYASTLSVNDLNNYNEVLFILKAGPLLDSNAYRLASINRKVLDSIYRTEPPEDRSAINNAIIINTMNKAVADKNFSRAVTVANFTRMSWGTNYLEAQKSYTMKLLQYLQAVKDTARYLPMAANYYDQYYMNVSVDSIKRKDSLAFEAAKLKARQNAPSSTDTGRRTFSFSFTRDDKFATDLNNAAWYFYEAAGNNNNYLAKAMLWSKRAVDLSPKPSFYDTYAHLLYKLNLYSEAESMQLKCIELAKAQRMDYRPYEESYRKMKTKSL